MLENGAPGCATPFGKGGCGGCPATEKPQARSVGQHARPAVFEATLTSRVYAAWRRLCCMLCGPRGQVGAKSPAQEGTIRGANERRRARGGRPSRSKLAAFPVFLN
jgi:hypothetical protein